MMKNKIAYVSLLVMFVALVSVSPAAVTAPTGGGKLALGFDGTDVVLGSGTKVTTWTDQVSDYDAAAVLFAQQPTLVDLDTGNGVHPVVDFDGSMNYMETAAFSSVFNQANVIFMVAAWDVLPVSLYMFDSIDGANRNALYSRSDSSFGMFAGSQIINGNVQAVTNTFQVYTAVFNGANSLLRIDGASVLGGNTGTLGLSGLTIGADRNGNQVFNGKIAEVLVYDGGLNTEQILAIETYLREKYIVTPDPDIATNPNPANSESGIPLDVVLSWTASPSAQPVDGQDVYFGEVKQDVIDADRANPLGVYQGAQDGNTFDPTGPLELGKTYYWRVDQVNGTTIWAGEVWGFTVASYVLVDNFEDYADTTALLGEWSENGQAWLALATDSALVLGEKSMELHYGNSSSPYYSAATRNFDPAQDWTISEVEAMDVWFKGQNANSAAPVYVEISDGVNTARQYLLGDDEMTDPNATRDEAWYHWRIDLDRFTNVSLTAVTELTFGVGDGINPAQATTGDIYIEDFRLYPTRCLMGNPDYDFNGDCTVGLEDFAIFATGWLETGLWP